MEIFKIVTLSLSAILLAFVGLSRLSNPIQAYLKNSGIKLDNNADLLNEIKGVSAVMFLGGILTATGISFEQFSLTSHTIACLLFLGFLLGRLIAWSSNGKPNKQIVQGIVFELVFGGLNLACLIIG